MTPLPDRTALPLRVVTYNVRRCLGVDGRYAPERIAAVLAEARPDVVALQELDVNRLRSGGIDQAQAIAIALRMQHHFHPAMQVMEELYGDAILSLHPMRLVRAAALPGPRKPWAEPRGALWVEIDVAGRPVQVVNTHFGLLPGERLAQANALLGESWLGGVPADQPAILLGDLNARPSSAAYRLLARHFLDVQAGRAGGPAPTFPGRWPLLRIDHMFVRGGIEVAQAGPLRAGDARIASDHLPLCADLLVPPVRERVPDTAAMDGPLPVLEVTL